MPLECRYLKSIDIPTWSDTEVYTMILGEVVGIHIRDDLITETGLVDVAKMLPIGRMGYNDYTRVDANSLFTMDRPK